MVLDGLSNLTLGVRSCIDLSPFHFKADAYDDDCSIPDPILIGVSDEVKNWLAKKGYDPLFGARPMARLIQQEIETVLADEVLFGKLADGGEVTIDLKEDQLIFQYS